MSFKEGTNSEHIDFLVEVYTVDESMSEFINMVRMFFKPFIKDLNMFKHEFVDPWTTRIEVMKMKREGWKEIRHSENGAHEIWILKKGEEERMMGY